MVLSASPVLRVVSSGYREIQGSSRGTEKLEGNSFLQNSCQHGLTLALDSDPITPQLGLLQVNSAGIAACDIGAVEALPNRIFGSSFE